MLRTLVDCIKENPELVLREFNWKKANVEIEKTNLIDFKFEFDSYWDAKYLSINILDKNENLLVKWKRLLNEIKQIEKEWFLIKWDSVYSEERVWLSNWLWEYKSFVVKEDSLILCTKK